MSKKHFLPHEAVLALIAMGMPTDKAEYLRTTRGNSWWGYLLLVTVLISSMVAGLLIPVFCLLWAPLGSWLVSIGLIPRDALLVDLEIWSTFGLALAGLIWGYVAFSLLLLTNRGLAVRSAITGIQQSMMTMKNRGSTRWLVGKTIARIDPRLPRDDYFIAYHWASIRVALWFALPLTLLTLPIMAWEIYSLSYARPEGVSAASMIRTRRFIPWEEIDGLGIGSHQHKSTRQLCYIVYVPQGPGLNLARWKTLAGSHDNLDQLARIDEQLRQHNIPWSTALYEFGIHEGQPQWNQACFDSLRAELPPEKHAMFDRVYRQGP